MWLTVEHITRYGYDAPINEAYTEVRLKPLHRDGQRCSSFTLVTEPRGATVDEYLDRYGNTVHHFDLLEVHESLSVTVRSEVWTTAAYEAEEPTLSPLDRWDFLAPTRYVDLADQVIEVAAATRMPADPVEAAWELMHAVRGAMTYERGTTNVHTTAAEALADGRGVCQDFSHVMIAACRARGDPRALRQRVPVRHRLGRRRGRRRGVPRLGRRPRRRHLDLARPDARHGTDRALRPARRRPRLRGRAALARRLPRHGDRDARGRGHDPRALSASSAAGSARSSAASPPSRSQRARSSSPISFETARTSTAGTPASAAARSTPKPSIASTSGACAKKLRAPPTAAEVWIGEGVRLGERDAERGDEARVRRDAVDHRPLGRRGRSRRPRCRPRESPARSRGRRRGPGGAPRGRGAARARVRWRQPPRPGRHRRRGRRDRRARGRSRRRGGTVRRRSSGW